MIAMRVALAVPLLLGIGAAQAQEAAQGAKLFRQQCAVCHTIKEGAHKVGPSLAGIFGREAGTAEGFTRYSKAMKAADITWTDETIAKYIAAPKEFIPGNLMAYAGMKSAENRQAVIAYLHQAAE